MSLITQVLRHLITQKPIYPHYLTTLSTLITLFRVISSDSSPIILVMASYLGRRLVKNLSEEGQVPRIVVARKLLRITSSYWPNSYLTIDSIP